MDLEIEASEGGTIEALNVKDKQNNTIILKKVIDGCHEDHLSAKLESDLKAKDIPSEEGMLMHYGFGSKAWPNPQLLVEAENHEPFPLYALPPTIKRAVEECVNFSQPPIPLAVGSALSGVSVAAQGLIDVARGNCLLGPVSLYILVLAESGERKTTVDKLFTEAIRAWERKKREQLKDDIRKFEADSTNWNALMEGLKSSLKRAKINEDGKKIDSLQLEIKDLINKKPIAPILPRLIYVDYTPEALGSMLAGGHHSAALISSEGGAFLGAHGMNPESIIRNLALINSLWGAESFPCDRRATEKSFILQGARLTIGISVQPETFQSFLKKTNNLPRGMGLLARFLFAFPKTTQGTRFFKRKSEWPYIQIYNNMISNLLDMPLQTNGDGEISPKVVNLSSEANELWIQFHNKIESSLGLGGKYECVNDMASKTAEQAVRLAAIFNASEGRIFEDISIEIFENAAIVAEWYLNEFRRYTMNIALPEEIQSTIKLKEWLIGYCLETNKFNFAVREIVQMGPNGFRDTAMVKRYLENLCAKDNVFWEDINKRTRVVVNPKLLIK